MAEQKGVFALLEDLAELRARNKALEKRIQFLEQRLEQRYVETKKEYDPCRFDNMRDMVLKVFLDSPATTEYTMAEVCEEFRAKYPHVNAANVNRRTLELCQPEFGRKLGRKQEPDGTVRYYLMLKEVEEVNV